MNEAILTLEEIKVTLAPIAEKYCVDSILLFGSYAKGTADSQSDVDLVIFGGEGFHPTDIFAMSEEIRAALGKQADVYEIQEINPGPPFMIPAFRKGFILYERQGSTPCFSFT